MLERLSDYVGNFDKSDIKTYVYRSSWDNLHFLDYRDSDGKPILLSYLILDYPSRDSELIFLRKTPEA